jgi:hypothetical protein
MLFIPFLEMITIIVAPPSLLSLLVTWTSLTSTTSLEQMVSS